MKAAALAATKVADCLRRLLPKARACPPLALPALCPKPTLPLTAPLRVSLPSSRRPQDLIDCDRLSTNNPAAMLAAYGVEACRATVVKEVSGVFGAYGIGVDPRHLSLIADFMTHLVSL